MKLHTTLRLLHEHGACEDRYRHLVKALGAGYGGDKPILLSRILRINGLDDTLWALRAVPDAQVEVRDRIARLYAADCAARVLCHYESCYPTDLRPRNAIVVARQHARGKATDAQLRKAQGAAVVATENAPWHPAATWYAAREAARAARWTAAWPAAVGAVVWAAVAARWVRVTERTWQTKRLALYLRGGPLPRPVPLPRRKR